MNSCRENKGAQATFATDIFISVATAESSPVSWIFSLRGEDYVLGLPWPSLPYYTLIVIVAITQVATCESYSETNGESYQEESQGRN